MKKSALFLDYVFLGFFMVVGFVGLFFYAYKMLFSEQTLPMLFVLFPLLFLFISLWFISVIKGKTKKIKEMAEVIE